MGISYVYKQPETETEVAALMEGVEGCPLDGVGADGDLFNWDTEPIKDWNAVAERWNQDISFEVDVPVIQKVAMEGKVEACPWWKRLFLR